MYCLWLVGRDWLLSVVYFRDWTKEILTYFLEDWKVFVVLVRENFCRFKSSFCKIQVNWVILLDGQLFVKLRRLFYVWKNYSRKISTVSLWVFHYSRSKTHRMWPEFFVRHRVAQNKRYKLWKKNLWFSLLFEFFPLRDQANFFFLV
jgi:hypothetical protein